MFCSNLAFAQEKPCNFIKFMEEAKNTARAVVRIGYDGLVHKTFKGPQARERYENELRVLQFLDQQGCSFVPKVVKKDNSELYLVTTNCGARVDHLSDKKKERIFSELKHYGIRHDDAEVRNITYNALMGRFCVIDFEFATILEPGYPPSPKMESVADRSAWQRKDSDE
jgi:predicted Ser/Thr protein kinase